MLSPGSVLVALYFFLMWVGINAFQSGMCGWRELARHYADPGLGGEVLYGGSGWLGQWRINRRLSLAPNVRGLKVGIGVLWKPWHPSLLIPWDDITINAASGVEGEGAVELQLRLCPGLRLGLDASTLVRLRELAARVGPEVVRCLV